MILILGSSGLIGSNISKELRKHFQLIEIDRSVLDVRDQDNVFSIIEAYKPDIIINTTGYLPADRCEENYIESYLVNVKGVANLIQAVKKIRPSSIFIHFSSDFVFDGKKGNYSEEDIPNPLSVYGMHKWIADELVKNSDLRFYIFRVASVIGIHHYKNTFLKAIIGKANVLKEVEVVADITISCSVVEFIAYVLVNFLNTLPRFGLYNVVCRGETSWFEIAKLAFGYLNIEIPIKPISSKDFPYKARRGQNTSLSVAKLEKVLGEVPLWKECLLEHLEKNKEFYRSLVG